MLLCAVALLNLQSWLTVSQVESVTFGNEFSSNIRASMSRGLQYQKLAVEGDIVVENGTYLVEDTELNLTVKIIARNNATVFIRNATLALTTRGYNYREGIVLADKSRLIVENATITLESADIGEQSYITVGDDAVVNITDSKLYGTALIIGRKNSRTYVNHSVLKGPSPINLQVFSVLTEDNSTARIQDSELDTAGARGSSSVYVSNSIIQTRGVSAGGNGLIEIENSSVGTSQWLWDNSTLRILNSTIDHILFAGSSLIVRDSKVHDIWASSNSTVWLMSVSVSRVLARGNSTLWLINSYAREIKAEDQGKVYVGWQLPLFGTIAFPHTWLPILQGLALLAALIIIIGLLVVLNRRWKRRQLQKERQSSHASFQS